MFRRLYLEPGGRISQGSRALAGDGHGWWISCMACNGPADCATRQGFLRTIPPKSGRLSSFTSLVWPLTRTAQPTYQRQRADHFRKARLNESPAVSSCSRRSSRRSSVVSIAWNANPIQFENFSGGELCLASFDEFCFCQSFHASRRQMQHRWKGRPFRFSMTTLSGVSRWPALQVVSTSSTTGPCRRL